MRTLISGATGFIGSHLLEELIKVRNKNDIFCLARSENSCSELKNKGVNVIKCSLEDKAALSNKLKGLNIQIVYHLAACARKNKTAKDYFVNNIIGTRNITEYFQMHHENLKKFIYMSSMHADLGNKTLYGKSKRIGEEIITETCRKMNIPYCILRAPIVYGPRNKADSGLMVFILNVKKNGLMSRLNFPGACSIVYVLDLVRLCLLVEKSETANNQIFYVCSDQSLPVADIFSKIYSALGIQRRVIKLPDAIFRLSASSLPLLSLFFSFGKDLEDSLKLLLTSSWTRHSFKTEKLLGFRPEYNIDKGLKMTLDYLRDSPEKA